MSVIQSQTEKEDEFKKVSEQLRLNPNRRLSPSFDVPIAIEAIQKDENAVFLAVILITEINNQKKIVFHFKIKYLHTRSLEVRASLLSIRICRREDLHFLLALFSLMKFSI